MSKRPITFNKPEDPSFLKQIKASIGYKDGPNVDTKRQKLDAFDSDDEEEDQGQLLDYKPQVVVLRAGDLTEEEAEREKQRLLKEEQEKPADLSQRVVFKKPVKTKSEDKEATESGSKDTAADKRDRKSSKTTSTASKAAGKLSFANEDEEEDF